jgi:hypothetical protein
MRKFLTFLIALAITVSAFAKQTEPLSAERPNGADGQQVQGIDRALVAPEAARMKPVVEVQPPLRRLSDERQ